ncbi:uncharacterized protein VP01_807g17 [Puccinia sorghi]|uniref:TM7S3/TM198-like domain-containing protein n=1 Tax=Puccinia sorghi TaxID=27349 RepID=A0A0L6UB69_9BASI|nr:uncharacterized protein VP01_807g17 [Puccinia sorghi]
MAKSHQDGRVFLLVVMLAVFGCLHPGALHAAAQAVQPDATAAGHTTTNTTLLQSGAARQTNQSQPIQNSTATTNTTSNNNHSNYTTTTLNNTRNDAAISANSTSSSGNSSSILNKDEAVPLDTKITVPFSILGVLLMVSGAPMGFWGGRNRWSSYFLTGAYVGALIVMTPILRFGVMAQDRHPSTAIQGVFVLACLISAIAAGAVAVIFWKGTRFLVGAGGGFVLSLFILSLKTNSLIEAAGLRWVVILISSSLGFVLATVPRLTIHVTLLATAAMGAAAVVLGIDCFTTAGLKEFWLFILGFGALFPRLAHFPFTITIQAELGVMGGLFLMGASVQWRLLEVIRKKIDELKQLDTDRRMEEEAAAYRQSMALDADLKMWERRYAEDGESVTMTLAASPPNKHSRKSSQFSLLPRLPSSPISPQTPNTTTLEKNNHSPLLSNNNNHPLLPLDVGGGLASSLGITEELIPPNHGHSSSMPRDQAVDFAESTAPQQRSLGESRSADGAVTIPFDRFDNDRRVARPPGAPSSWTSPLGSTKPITTNTMASGMTGQDSPRMYGQDWRRSAHDSRTTTEHVSPVLLHGPSDDLPAPKPRPASRILVGSYSSQPPVRGGVPAQRESKVMTIAELEQRHKLAMKKLQQPATNRLSVAPSPKLDPTPLALHHSSSTGNLNPPDLRDHRRRSSHLPSTLPRSGKQDHLDHTRRSRHLDNSSALRPSSSTSPSGPPPPSASQKTAPWLSY